MNTGEASPYSHPRAPVRHSYPVSIQRADMATAWSLVMRTLPYAGLRFGVLFGASLATALWWLVTIGGASFLGTSVHGTAGLLWLLACLFSFAWGWRALVRYVLHLLKAGHIAVLTELVTRGRVGDGREWMFAYGRRVVTQRFGQISALLALEMLVRTIVDAFNCTLGWIGSLVPVPALRERPRVAKRIVRASTIYVDETILSYNLARGDEDTFRSTADGLVYYAQNSQEILKTGTFVVVVDKVASLVTWLVMFLPALALGAFLPAAGKGVGFLFTAAISYMFAWSIRDAFLEPLFLTMVMIKFHVCVKGQTINLEWDERLSQVSHGFQDLKRQIGSNTAGATPARLPRVDTYPT